VQLLKAPMAILADSLSYLWSAAWVFTIRRAEPPVERHEDGARPTMRSQIGEGLRYVWHHPLLRPIAFCTANSNLFGSMVMAILVLFAVRTLGMSPGLIGLVFALGNVGFLVGAFAARRAAERLGLGATIVGAAVLFGLGGVLVPLASRSTGVPILVGSAAIFGFGGVVYNINQVSLRQAITPLRMQGRMNATMRFMVWGTMPIGAFVGGVLGKTIGLRPTLWIAAAGGLLSFLPPALSQVRTLERIPEMSEDEPIPASIPGPIPTGS